jgi:putative ABC transport system permease protein
MYDCDMPSPSAPIVASVLQDFRYAVRLMGRNPAFTALAVLTLALGVGINTAIFSVTDAVLLRELPVTDPEQLVVLDAIPRRGGRNNISNPLFERIRGESGVFSGVFAAMDGAERMGVRASEGEQTADASVQLVSGEYFDLLGVSAFGGRTLKADDNRASAAPASAVLSHDFWKRRFAGHTGVIGTTLTVRNQPFTIVGVMRPGFFGEAVGRAPDIWLPLRAQPLLDRGMSLLDNPSTGWLRVIARVRAGVSRQQVDAALAVMLAGLQADAGDLGRAMRHYARIAVSDGSQGVADFRDQFSPSLRILTVVAGIVLLIACANVSSLLLARATVRRREVAVRLALGAGRLRLIRQFLVESLTLAVAGSLLGVVIAAWCGPILLTLLSDDATSVLVGLSADVRMLGFATAISIATTILLGLAPAIAGSRADVGGSLRLADHIRSRPRLSPIFVVGQIALTILVLTAAALFVQTLWNLRNRDVGFAADALVQIRIRPEVSGYTPDALGQLSDRIVERLRAIPGVQAVSVAHSGFATGISTTCCVAVEGHRHGTEDRTIATIGVAPGYFATMGLRLVTGRDFAASDVPSDPRRPRVAIVNEEFVRRYGDSGNAIGRRFGWGNPQKVRYEIEIVGVARDAIYGDLRRERRPLVYFATSQGSLFVVRSTTNPQGMIPSLRREIRAIDSGLEIGDIRTVSDEVERTLVREKLLANLSGIFGLLAAILAAIGLYGLTAYTVVARTREIGVRIALGASSRSVLGDELRSAMRLVTIGTLFGIPSVVVAGRLISHQMFGVSTHDPATLAVIVIVVTLVACVAAFGPARRASRVDPMIALRCE